MRNLTARVFRSLKTPLVLFLVVMTPVIINAHYREIQEQIHKGISELYETNESLADWVYEANDFVFNGKSFDLERKQKSAIYSSFESVTMVSVKPGGTSPGGIGTGWFARVDETHGWIITNYHVISDAKDRPDLISVTTALDMWDYDAEIIGYDEIADIAVLKIAKKDDEKWTALEIEDASEIAMGDPVVVMGHGMSLPYTASQGFVSYAQRYGTRPYSLMLQVDAVINQGNSGGPVIGMNGKVYGVAQSILSPSRAIPGWDGIGLAVGAKQVQRSFDFIISPNYISKGYVPYVEFPFNLSVKKLEEVYEISKDDRHYAYIDYSSLPEGAETTVGQDSGLLQGDILWEIDGENISSSFGVLKKTVYAMPGDVWKVKVKRGEDFVELDIAMREMDRNKLLGAVNRGGR